MINFVDETAEIMAALAGGIDEVVGKYCDEVEIILKEAIEGLGFGYHVSFMYIDVVSLYGSTGLRAYFRIEDVADVEMSSYDSGVYITAYHMSDDKGYDKYMDRLDEAQGGIAGGGDICDIVSDYLYEIKCKLKRAGIILN